MADIYVKSGASGAANGTSWTDAYTTLSAGCTGATAGDRIVVSNNHSETSASGPVFPGTYTTPCTIICVDDSVASGWTASDLRTTAVVGHNTLSLGLTNASSGCNYIYGITFQAGSTTINASVNINTTAIAGRWVFEACTFKLNGNNASSRIAFGVNTAAQLTVTCDFELINCTVQFANASQAMTLENGNFWFRAAGTPITGATQPSQFLACGSRAVSATIEGVDFSSLGSGKYVASVFNGSNAKVTIKDCKLASGVLLVNNGTFPGPRFVVNRATSSTSVNYDTAVYMAGGYSYMSTAVRRTGGATQPDGTIVSQAIVTDANVERFAPYHALPISEWNSSTSALTATIHGICTASSMPTNAQVWMDVCYLSATSTLGTWVTTAPATVLTTASSLTADTSTWDGGATTRANSTAYSLGDIIKVSSNSGRLFICTTAGTSSGSLPAAYASAVDGDGSITDGTAVFQAVWRFKMTTASITPGQQGRIFAYPRIALTNSNAYPNIYLDPKLVFA